MQMTTITNKKILTYSLSLTEKYQMNICNSILVAKYLSQRIQNAFKAALQRIATVSKPKVTVTRINSLSCSRCM